jgi:hypothetical protein
MKKLTFLGAFIATLAAAPAFASDLCSVPQAEWQPKEALQKQLEADGWTIKKINVDEGCYEVYAKKGDQRMESYFNPKTFEVVKQ